MPRTDQNFDLNFKILKLVLNSKHWQKYGLGSVRNAYKRSFMIALSVCLLPLTMTQGHAAEAQSILPTVFFSNGANLMVFIGLAVGIGYVLFLTIRRNNITAQKQKSYQNELRNAKIEIARYQALISDNNRRIVIWDGNSTSVQVLGDLPAVTKTPEKSQEFLKFGRWLEAESAQSFEYAVHELRKNGHTFDMNIETQRGQMLEVQGGLSGNQAFVRFSPLTNLRAQMAQLQAEHNRLKSSLETFQSLFDVLDMPLWLRAHDGSLTWVNEAYTYAVEAKNSNEVIENTKEILGLKGRESIKSTRTPGNPFIGQLSTVVRGERVFFEVTDSVGPSGSAGIAYDSSMLEQVKCELARTEETQTEILNQLQTPVAIFDGQQSLQFYNQAFCLLWGLNDAYLSQNPTHSELLEKLRTNDRLEEPASWREWKSNQLAVYQSNELDPELWHLPNGQILNVFAKRLPNTGAIWVFENLTAQVELETRYNTLVKVQGETIDHLDEGVVVFGVDGKLQLANPAFRALWGITQEDSQNGRHINEIAEYCEPSYSDDDGWKMFSAEITGLSNERHTLEGRLELKTGLMLDYALVPLPNAQNMLTFVNVSDSVQVERALKTKNETLQKADQLKSDFVQHVSYELRSPLTNIIGFTDLLKTPGIGDLNERQDEYIDHISTSSSVLLTIVNDILDLATLDAGIMELDKKDFQIQDLITDTEMQIIGLLRENDIAIDISIDDGIDTIFADPHRMKQILFKLLNNAVNYTENNGTIALTCTRDDGDIVFAVSDTGSGISIEQQANIFTRFSTNGTPGRKRGAGLGLSIVRSFVELHGGRIEVDSTPGKGTTFICRFPDNAPQPKIIAAQ